MDERNEKRPLAEPPLREQLGAVNMAMLAHGIYARDPDSAVAIAWLGLTRLRDLHYARDYINGLVDLVFQAEHKP
jgi:hypothetical protein